MNDEIMEDSADNRAIIAGVEIAMLILAKLTTLHGKHLRHCVHRDLSANTEDILFLWHDETGYTILGSVTLRPGDLIAIDYTHIEAMAASIALLKDN